MTAAGKAALVAAATVVADQAVKALVRTTIERGPLVFHAPCINIGPACIWGATSVILGELSDVLHQTLNK